MRERSIIGDLLGRGPEGRSMTRLRVLTLNLWGSNPPFERRMQVIASGLARLQPDVAALQEVLQTGGPETNSAGELASQCSLQWVWAPAFTAPSGAQEGLAILSRWEILHHRA